jgi:hypothetical protein
MAGIGPEKITAADWPEFARAVQSFAHRMNNLLMALQCQCDLLEDDLLPAARGRAAELKNLSAEIAAQSRQLTQLCAERLASRSLPNSE